MYSVLKYLVVLLVGVALGYWGAQQQQQQQQPQPQISSQPLGQLGSSAPANTSSALNDKPPPVPAATLPRPQQPTHTELPTMSEPAWQQSTVDENWLAFVEQQYPKRLQQDLSAFPDPVKKRMQAFQQTVVDTEWAQATEQKLQDLLVTQQELKLLQVERVQCRQDGCEIYGTSLASSAMDAFERQLRQFHATNTNTMIMDLTKPGTELGNFYMLVTGMKKD